jgi:hypothetical protein
MPISTTNRSLKKIPRQRIYFDHMVPLNTYPLSCRSKLSFLFQTLLLAYLIHNFIVLLWISNLESLFSLHLSFLLFVSVSQHQPYNFLVVHLYFFLFHFYFFFPHDYLSFFFFISIFFNNFFHKGWTLECWSWVWVKILNIRNCFWLVIDDYVFSLFRLEGAKQAVPWAIWWPFCLRS